jgi:hypothetical protein
MAVMGYKLSHDSGFAPNPFHGALTLATCKPAIRRRRIKGDWIAGFVSKNLAVRSRAVGVHVELGALVYLAQVTDNPIELGDYHACAEFRCKRPCGSSEISRAGDNIYARVGGVLVQQPNFHHGQADVVRDKSGGNALVCRRFYYFGRSAFLPPSGWAGFLKRPPARTFYCPDDFADKLLREFDVLGIEPGIIGAPCGWDERLEGPFNLQAAGRRGCAVRSSRREMPLNLGTPPTAERTAGKFSRPAV